MHNKRVRYLKRESNSGLFFKRMVEASSGIRAAILPVSVLTKQYRMNEPIMRLTRDLFYSFYEMGEKDPNRDWISNRMNERVSASGIYMKSVTVLDLSGEVGVRAEKFLTGSFYNHYEATVIADMVKTLCSQTPNMIKSIGILTPYTAQVSIIRNTIPPHLRSLRCCTFESAQGQEFDIVILSLVRTGKASNMSFLDNENTLCMTLSRAREYLVIVGSVQDVFRGSVQWRKVFTLLQSYCKDNDSSNDIQLLNPTSLDLPGIAYNANSSTLTSLQN